jgi:2-methylisocitrate lyase-like PEP mutase family enzyme
MGFAESAISRSEMVDKIRCAVEARTDPSLIIIARSTIQSDFNEIKERLRECLAVGADAFWLALRDPAQIRDLCSTFSGKPGFGVLPGAMTAQEYEACGARCGLIPGALSIAALHAQRQLLEEIKKSGTATTYLSAQAGIDVDTEFYSKQGAGEL